MFETIISANNINFIIIFFGGVLSFFSPCVVPLIPIYMSYLAGNAKQTGEDGSIYYKRSKVFFHTVFFVLGISFAFFVLGMSFTALGSFFKSNQILFTRIGGILIIMMGLIQLGFLEFKFLQRDRKLPINFKNIKMNPIAAFLMGFTFSFAWTPCVGPALSSVLILAAGAQSSLLGNFLVLIYTLGFIIPFLLLGLFTTQVLNFLKKRQNILKYTVKVGGLLLILIGIMTFTGWMNGISRYLNSFAPPIATEEMTKEPDDIISENEEDETTKPKDTLLKEENTKPKETLSEEKNDNNTDGEDENTQQNSSKTPAFDFTLVDQYGNEHTLSDYKGKVVFLNFWATWCPPCKKEMPDIEELYNKYNKNQDDVIILGVANPASDEYPNNSDVSKKQITEFLEENEYTFPTVFDETGDLLRSYFISAFPTTFMIDKEGNIFGYVPGMLSKDMMINIIDQTLEATE
ncbi:redoxin family protein [Mobilitalea sibirica]|uniref:Redoxin family protein n=1 Tax=Mobilitalea sibirica TaxID=1462919 RepID=A0A8J7KT07_9FIRM|nr:cytochrome c biogenesis protein CcdA [Mobilitalea sibirica]MBH1940851.1 redoxin family protein [Mobilitalea sibirica]